MYTFIIRKETRASERTFSQNFFFFFFCYYYYITSSKG